MFKTSSATFTNIDVSLNASREKRPLDASLADSSVFCTLNRPRKKSLCLLFVLSASLFTQAWATEGGRDNTSPGSETFFTVPPGILPGVYLNSYYYHYAATHFGSVQRFRTSIDVFSERVVYISPWKFLGARIGAYGFAPLYDQTIRANGVSNHKTSFGDLTVSPALIWSIKHKLGLSTGIEITMPSGQYNAREPVNAGLNYYTYKPYVAFTWVPTPRTEFSMRHTYSFNTTNGKTHYHSGQVYHFDFSASYEVFKDLHAGLNGYYLKQTTDDKVRGDVFESGNRGRVFAVGPGLRYSFSHDFSMEMRWMKELKVQNRARGDAFWFKVMLAHP